MVRVLLGLLKRSRASEMLDHRDQCTIKTGSTGHTTNDTTMRAYLCACTRVCVPVAEVNRDCAHIILYRCA